MSAVLVRVRAVVRRGWPATIALAVLVGLGAGVAMATVAASRRAATAYERFVAHADPPQLVLNFCPPEVTEIDGDSVASCFTYVPIAERDVIAALPEVEAAGSGAFRGVTLAAGPAEEDIWAANAYVLRDPDIAAMDGTHLLVEGRWHEPEAVEIVLNEPLVEVTGLRPGDDVALRFWSADEVGLSGERGTPFSGPAATARVVGVSRGLQDLMAFTRPGEGAVQELRIHAGSGLYRASADAPGFFGGLFVQGHGDVEDLLAAIEAAFPGRPFNAIPAMGEDELAPAREAIAYEARAVTALGGLLGAAVVVIAGQAIARQARREALDARLLQAIGCTRAQLGAAGFLRGLCIGAPAALVATVAMVALSPLGPVGVGRLAETDPGVVVDAPVLVVGAALLLVLCGVSAWSPQRAALTRGARPGGREPAWGALTWLPAPVAVGLRLGRLGRWAGRLPSGTAVAGVALAAGTVVAASVLTASFGSLERTPERFGAPWDLSFSTHFAGDDNAAVAGVAAHPDVAAGAALVGTDAVIGGETAWVQAFAPLPELDARIHPPIVEGRAPASVDEIALGTVTKAELGLELGDQVEVGTAVAGSGSAPLTVVGTTVINDNWEHSPGRGGVVTPEWIERWAPEATPSPYVITLRPGADHDALVAWIRDEVGDAVSEPMPQTAVRNVGRISGLPYLLAAFVTVMAAGAFGHALVLSVRRQRQPLAVLRSLGFTGRQVGTTVHAYAAVLGLASVAIGLPLGVVAGRWGWRVIAERLGVMTVEVMPLGPLAAVVVGAVAFTAVVAAVPAWQARRAPVGPALRTE